MMLDECVLWVQMPEGWGGLLVYDILAILPDTNSPLEKSLVCTGCFPQGLTVIGNAEDLLVEWETMLTEAEDDEEDDDCDDE